MCVCIRPAVCKAPCTKMAAALVITASKSTAPIKIQPCYTASWALQRENILLNMPNSRLNLQLTCVQMLQPPDLLVKLHV
mmetsp:Transcript_96229/g.281032  ORF Transcript_96229/g.281032 Transcript_96229/m.281032 type:complete len:80 (+) Transcript_96229:226-465(+)